MKLKSKRNKKIVNFFSIYLLYYYLSYLFIYLSESNKTKREYVKLKHLAQIFQSNILYTYVPRLKSIWTNIYIFVKKNFMISYNFSIEFVILKCIKKKF